ncbi:unnamed protein product, partial [Medioppia subpectinata]
MDYYEYFISCEILQELLKCLQYLHDMDPPVIHRDLKPENVLISPNNMHIKLCDFGLATDHVSPSMDHTQGTGTPQYMAIEVITSRQYSIKADIYSLGVIASHLFDADLNVAYGWDSTHGDYEKRQLLPLPRIGRSYAMEKRQGLIPSPRVGRSSATYNGIETDCSLNPELCNELMARVLHAVHEEVPP